MTAQDGSTMMIRHGSTGSAGSDSSSSSSSSHSSNSSSNNSVRSRHSAVASRGLVVRRKRPRPSPREKTLLPFNTPSPSPSPSRGLSPVTSASGKETRMMEFFCLVGAPRVWGIAKAPLSSPTWLRLAFQTALAEPAARYAALTMASLYEKYESGAGPSNPFALSCYNKSIQYLAAPLTNGDEYSTDLALLVCYLLVCAENLQGNLGRALVHISNGMAIHYSHYYNPKTLPATWVWIDGASNPRNTVARGWKLMHAHVTSFIGLAFTASFPTPVPPLSAFDSFCRLDHVYDCMYAMLGMHYEFLAATPVSFPSNDEPRSLSPSNLSKHDYLSRLLSKWQVSVTNWYARMEENSHPVISNPVVNHHYKHLCIHAMTMAIQLEASLGCSEMAYDVHLPTLKALLGPLEECIRIEDPTTSDALPIDLYANVPIAAALWFIAIKCRDPETRRSAIALLRANKVRHGIWYGPSVARVAQLLLRVEEGGAKVKETADVKVGMRAHGLVIEPEDEEKRVRISFWRMIGGGVGKWRKRVEYVDW